MTTRPKRERPPPTGSSAPSSRGEAAKLLGEAFELLRTAEHAMWKLGLYEQGDDLRLSHEVRMFSLHFSPRTTPEPPPEHVLCWKGTGRLRAWMDASSALLDRLRRGGEG